MSSPPASRPFDDLLLAMRSVRHLDRRFWAPNIVFLLDGAAYFGILNVLTLHLDGTVGLGEARAGQLVSYMTALLTIAMVFLGPSVDKLGVRRSLTWTIVASLLGRALLVATPAVGGGLPMVVAGLSLMAVGGGVMQTAVYAGVKQATDERTSSVGFSLIYALMNLGIVLESAVSSPVRATWGTTGVLAMCTGLTALYLLVHLVSFPKNAGNPLPPAPPDPTQAPKTWREHPLLDLRFLYFIFILIGVRTLFAHQWLTMPDYVTRSFPEEVGARFEWISGLNPLIIVIGTPLVAALTQRVPVLTMMILGTGVSALATLLLVPGPNLPLLLTYVVIFSIGEALWSSRFLEYVSQLAPPEKVGVYMGLANVPWFLAKFTTGLYSGAMIARFIPREGPQDTGTLWLVYTAIALSSPVGLLLARGWLRRTEPAPR
jgi:POT family proton-dependent oligopeptide transporter